MAEYSLARYSLPTDRPTAEAAGDTQGKRRERGREAHLWVFCRHRLPINSPLPTLSNGKFQSCLFPLTSRTAHTTLGMGNERPADGERLPTPPPPKLRGATRVQHTRREGGRGGERHHVHTAVSSEFHMKPSKRRGKQRRRRCDAMRASGHACASRASTWVSNFSHTPRDTQKSELSSFVQLI